MDAHLQEETNMEKERRKLGKTLKHVLYPMLIVCLLLGGCGGDDESGDSVQTPLGSANEVQTPVAGTKGLCEECLHDSECAGNLTCNSIVDNYGVGYVCSTRAEEPVCRLKSPRPPRY
jgi:hypothetical protein